MANSFLIVIGLLMIIGILSFSNIGFAQVTVNPQYICQPNQKVCAGNVIQKCNPYGSGYETIEVCEGKCGTLSGTAEGLVCITKEEIDRQNFYGNFLLPVLIFGGLSAVLIIFSIKAFRDYKKGFKKSIEKEVKKQIKKGK